MGSRPRVSCGNVVLARDGWMVVGGVVRAERSADSGARSGAGPAGADSQADGRAAGPIRG